LQEHKHQAVKDKARHDLDVLRRAVAGVQRTRFEAPEVRRTPVLHLNDHFAKTGSGQT
jgi:hypothetical protein